MSHTTQNPELVSQGVDELITRLRTNGVEAGKSQAETIINDAKDQAKAIIAKAEAEAREKIMAAQKKADAVLNGGQEALKTAKRDLVLNLKAELTENFKADVKRLVEKELEKPDMLKAIILEMAGKLSSAANIQNSESTEFLLPVNTPGLKELQERPERLENSPLTDYVFSITRDMLIEGVRFDTSSELTGGLSVRLEGQDLVMDFSDEAITDMLLEHLQPRFRAILEGVVR